MYIVKWSWGTEFKIFLVRTDILEYAKSEARDFVGEGGTLEFERLEWDAASTKERLRNVFTIMSSEDL